MRQRIDDLLPHSTFYLDKELYYLRKFENGVAECEKENGSLAFLSGWVEIDEWERSRFNWLTAILP